MREFSNEHEFFIDNGKEIRQHRKQLGLSQEALAHAVGVEQSLISKVERGKVKSKGTINKIINALNCWKS